MVNMGSPGSSPLCDCSQNHNKGRTHPASLQGQCGEAQANGKGGHQAQDPKKWECPLRQCPPLRDEKESPQVMQPLAMTLKPGAKPGLLHPPRREVAQTLEAFMKACRGYCPGMENESNTQVQIPVIPPWARHFCT